MTRHKAKYHEQAEEAQASDRPESTLARLLSIARRGSKQANSAQGIKESQPTRLKERARNMGSNPSVNEKQIRVNGLKINYLEAGSGERCVLLIHGGVNNTAFSTWIKWNDTIGALSKDYRVLAPDLPGYGASEKPGKCTQAYYVKFIKDFLDAAGVRKANLIGTSMGAGIAIGSALKNNESVESMVLISPYGLGFTLPRRSRLGLAIPYSVIDRAIGFLDGHKKLTKAVLKVIMNEELKDSIIRSIEMMNRDKAKEAFFEFIRNEAINPKGMILGRRTGLRTDYRKSIYELNKGNMRILFIQGENDSIVESDAIKSIVSGLRNADIRVFRGCKHSPHFQEPEKFNNEVKGFLQNGSNVHYMAYDST